MDNIKKGRILVVDDENSNIIILKNILSSEYTVYASTSGADAIEAARELLPDIILLDVLMPNMDGYEVLSALKSFEKTANIPVIIITSLSDEEDEKKGFDLGAVDYITKPFTPTIVKIRIENQMKIIKQLREILRAEIERQSAKELAMALERANEANRAKSVFLANMSHEIRTPMSGIIGFAELAIADDIADKTREYLNMILDNSEHLLHLINDILDLSKIEAKKTSLAKSPFNLQDVFLHCYSVMRQSAEEKGLSLTCHADVIVQKELLGDPFRLGQVLKNLLSNAIKFTNVGEVKLSAKLISENEHEASIYFEIQDSGIGMTREQITKVFEPFVQADDSIEREYGGTGLGLAISKDILDLMGGTLEVKSTPGIGSVFSFELTFELVEASENGFHTQMQEYSRLEKPNFDGEILVCEDNLMNRKVIKDNLERLGIETVIARNGEEGVDFVIERIQKKKKPFDLIFMDIHMPVMNGLVAAQKITEMETGTPIVALTANIMQEDLESYKLSGIYDYLGKPFKTKDLWRCLLKYLIPVGVSDVDKDKLAEEEDKFQNYLRLNFVKNNQTVFSDILSATQANDIELAGRLAHTLKSNAGQIGERSLQGAAAAVERSLSDNKGMVSIECMNVLEEELIFVLDKLSPLLAEAPVHEPTLSALDDEAVELLDKIEIMLENHNPQCIELVDDLRMIFGAEKLAEQIEDFDFKGAAANLRDLRGG